MAPANSWIGVPVVDSRGVAGDPLANAVERRAGERYWHARGACRRQAKLVRVPRIQQKRGSSFGQNKSLARPTIRLLLLGGGPDIAAGVERKAGSPIEWRRPGVPHSSLLSAH